MTTELACPAFQRLTLAYTPMEEYALYGRAFHKLPKFAQEFLITKGFDSPSTKHLQNIEMERDFVRQALQDGITSILEGWAPHPRPCVMYPIPLFSSTGFHASIFRPGFPYEFGTPRPPLIPFFNVSNNSNVYPYMPHCDPGVDIDIKWLKDAHMIALPLINKEIEAYLETMDALVWYEMEVRVVLEGTRPLNDEQKAHRMALTRAQVGEAQARFTALVYRIANAIAENNSTRRWVASH